jgi:cytochrome c-type biogenesis protein
MLSPILAFSAGLVSVASPCILPVIPIIMAGSYGGKLRPIAIVIGMTLSFTFMGIATSVLGSVFQAYVWYLRTFAIGIVIAMGCLLLSEKIEAKLYELRQMLKFQKIKVGHGQKEGLVGGFLLGISLGIIWIPCVGPILGAILAMIAIEGKVISGAFLLFVYSMGIGIPMLAIAYISKLSAKVSKIAKYGLALRKSAGIVLILVGVGMLFGIDKHIIMSS